MSYGTQSPAEEERRVEFTMTAVKGQHEGAHGRDLLGWWQAIGNSVEFGLREASSQRGR